MRPPCPRGHSRVIRILSFMLGFVSGATALAGQSAGNEAADSAYFSAYHTVPRDTVTPGIYEGWKQYALYCARCHGDWGVGTSFAPALVESVKATGTIPTQEMFIQTVCAGRMDKGMPAWCTLGLDIAVMQAIHSYLLERADGRLGLGRPAVLGR